MDENSRETHEDEESYTKTDHRVLKQEAAEDEPVVEVEVEEPPVPEPEVEAEPEPEPEVEAEPEPEVEAEPEPEVEAEPEPDEAEVPPDTSEIGVYGVLRFSLSMLIQQAWIALGIQAPPGKETREDLPEAKVAIDSIGDIVARLRPDLTDAEHRELEGLMATLRINYVQRAG